MTAEYRTQNTGYRMVVAVLLCTVSCLLSPAFADTHTSIGTGLFSAAGTWNPAGPPADTDAFVIADTHVVTFDQDTSAYAGFAASTINAGGTLIASTNAGAYVLKMNANLTVNGTLQAGTSVAVPYPSTCTFFVNFSGGAYGIVLGAAGKLYLYCTQPANRWIKLSAAELSGQTILSVDTDVTGDIWAVGDLLRLDDVAFGRDTQEAVIDAGGIAAGTITVTAGTALNSDYVQYAKVILCTRNIKIFNNSGTGALINLGTATDCYIAALLDDMGNDGLRNGVNCEFAGVCNNPLFAGWSSQNGTGNIMSGVMTGGAVYAIYFNCVGMNISGLISGFVSVVSSVYGYTVSGEISGCGTAVGGVNALITGKVFGCGVLANFGTSLVFTSTSILENITTCFSDEAGAIFMGTATGVTTFALRGSDIYCYNASITATTLFNATTRGKLYNCALTVTNEFANYNTAYNPTWAYTESTNHDQVVNAEKDWTRGGIVESSTAAPLPTGHTIRYDLTAEDVTQTYPVFRQYETVVQPGTAIEVSGWLAIPNGENLTGYAPYLAIIDAYADPLVDATQSNLDIDYIPDPDGSETGYQSVSVIWANQGASPRIVKVRMVAWNDGGADDVVVYSAWSVADYQDHIATILSVVRPTTGHVSVSNTASTFTLDFGQATADAYKNMTLQVRDADTGFWEERSVTGWTAAKVVTVDTAFSFIPAVDDQARITATSYGGPVDTIAIADSVWDEAIADHTGETTFGGELQQLDPNVTILKNYAAEWDPNFTAMLADTNELQTDWTNGGRLDLLIDAIKAITDKLPNVTTTVSDANDANSFTVTAGAAATDAYLGHIIVIIDAHAPTLPESRLITYWSSARVVEVDMPFTFTPAAGDAVTIWSVCYWGELWENIDRGNSTTNVFDLTGGGATSGQGTTIFNQDGDDP